MDLMISMQHLGPSYSAGALLRVDQPNCGWTSRTETWTGILGVPPLGFSSKHWSGGALEASQHRRSDGHLRQLVWGRLLLLLPNYHLVMVLPGK